MLDATLAAARGKFGGRAGHCRTLESLCLESSPSSVCLQRLCVGRCPPEGARIVKVPVCRVFSAHFFVKRGIRLQVLQLFGQAQVLVSVP